MSGEAKTACPHDWKIIDTQVMRGQGPVFELLCRKCGQRRDVKGIDELSKVGGIQKTHTRPVPGPWGTSSE